MFLCMWNKVIFFKKLWAWKLSKVYLTLFFLFCLVLLHSGHWFPSTPRENEYLFSKPSWRENGPESTKSTIGDRASPIRHGFPGRWWAPHHREDSRISTDTSQGLYGEFYLLCRYLGSCHIWDAMVTYSPVSDSSGLYIHTCEPCDTWRNPRGISWYTHHECYVLFSSF